MTARRILFHNHRKRIVEGGTYNVLIQYVDVSAPNPFGAVLCNPFITAECILFPNHRNRKVVGGKHNILVLYVDASAPGPSNVVLCNPFKWDILWFISGWKSNYFCACNNSKKNFIPWPQGQESCRRQTQCSSTLCWWLYTQPIWCYPLQPFQMRYFVVHFDQKSCFLYAFHNSKMNFILQPHIQKSGRRQTQCSSTLCGC